MILQKLTHSSERIKAEKVKGLKGFSFTLICSCSIWTKLKPQKSLLWIEIVYQIGTKSSFPDVTSNIKQN